MTEAVQSYPSLQSAQSRYREARVASHRAAVLELRKFAGQHKFAGLTITAITPHALEAYESQWTQGERLVGWDWEKQVDYWRRKRPSFWEMAIWHKQTLCGLVVGGTSRRRSRLYVEGIEGKPGDNPLRTQITPVALLASAMYAEAIGCEEIWIVEPHEALMAQFEQAGYNLRLPNKFNAKIFRQNRYAVKKLGE